MQVAGRSVACVVLLPRVAPARIAKQFTIGQALEKRNRVLPFLCCKRSRLEPRAAIRVWRSAAGHVMVQDSVKRRNASVVHVRRSQRDVAQRWDAKLSDVLQLASVRI